jgi:multicomponent Na+:H+ antiporter subunit E
MVASGILPRELGHAPAGGAATTTGGERMPGESSDSETAGQTPQRRKTPGVDGIAHTISLLLTMFATWLLLSGYFEAFLLALGVLSCIVVVAIAHRMDVVDRESFPVHLTSKVLTYWPWLLKEIWLAAIDVTKRVLAPGMPISPTVVELKTTQHSDLGQVIYANSITLTPGTFTIRVYENKVLVHALSREGADSLAAGEMDRRVTAMEAG